MKIQEQAAIVYLEFHDVTAGGSSHQSRSHVDVSLVQGADIPWLLIVVYHLKESHDHHMIDTEAITSIRLQVLSRHVPSPTIKAKDTASDP